MAMIFVLVTSHTKEALPTQIDNLNLGVKVCYTVSLTPKLFECVNTKATDDRSKERNSAQKPWEL